MSSKLPDPSALALVAIVGFEALGILHTVEFARRMPETHWQWVGIAATLLLVLRSRVTPPRMDKRLSASHPRRRDLEASRRWFARHTCELAPRREPKGRSGNWKTGDRRVNPTRRRR
jgi:hypothetical protein